VAQWLLTCRHDYEGELRDEIARMGLSVSEIAMPGAVLTQVPDCGDLAELRERLIALDPVYALQVLPEAVQIEAPSIAGLADAALNSLLPRWLELGAASGAGRFAVHVLVPGQLKGQPRPLMQRRAELLAQAVKQRVFKEERHKPLKTEPVGRLLQILLVDNEVAWVSAAPVVHPAGAMNWPSLLPAGLCDPPDDARAPSSAFRKLREALACMGDQPGPGDVAVDLGASPGGWSHVLRECGAEVHAVDRAPLDKRLMADPHIHWHEADAFRWMPDQAVAWMVSDVIAYPQRVPELLAAWCPQPWARRLVVQMKFKGSPDFALIDQAIATARQAGWWMRAKHFFNDKHEITLMGGCDAVSLAESQGPIAPEDLAGQEVLARG
jgi:23S rRNA (cytidine2498-2'-O)-methyltransferase